MTMRIIIAAGALALLTACQTGEERLAAREAALTNVTPVGQPVDCVQTNLIRSTRVLADNVIDFQMRNGDVYRNTLPTACPNLRSEDRFSYRTTIGRLCSIDTITVLQSGGIPGPTCGLGSFQQVERTAQ
jgi:hypothetical protein